MSHSADLLSEKQTHKHYSALTEVYEGKEIEGTLDNIKQLKAVETTAGLSLSPANNDKGRSMKMCILTNGQLHSP